MSSHWITHRLKYVLVALLLVAAQCGTSLNSSPTPQQPAPTPLLIAPIQPGDGTDVMDRLLETGVLRTGIRVWPEANFSPPVFRGASNAITGGALNGFEVDIAHRVAEGLGLELELIEAPPLVIAGGVWRGEWDIALASLAPFDQPLAGMSTQNMVYSQPYGYIPLGVLLPKSKSNVQTLKQLSGLRVGVLEHSSWQRLLTPIDSQPTVQGHPLMLPPPDVQVVVVSNLLKAIRHLGQSQGTDGPPLDAIFGSAPMLEEAVKQGFSVKLAPEAGKVGIQPLVIATVPQDGLKVERLMLEINKILTRLQRDGTLAEIYLRWYDQDLSRPP